MIEQFKIFIDRLKDGSEQKIEGSFSPELLEVDEKELQFHHPVVVDAVCYTAEEDLIIQITASTLATMPCAICNEWTTIEISASNYYVTEPLEEIKGAVYDFGLALREALLTQVPHVGECNQGHCPDRKLIEPFLRKEDEIVQSRNPFKDIDLEL